MLSYVILSSIHLPINLSNEYLLRYIQNTVLGPSQIYSSTFYSSYKFKSYLFTPFLVVLMKKGK